MMTLFQEHLQEHRDPFVGGTRYKFEILRFMVIADKGQFFMGQGEQMSYGSWSCIHNHNLNVFSSWSKSDEIHFSRLALWI